MDKNILESLDKLCKDSLKEQAYLKGDNLDLHDRKHSITIDGKRIYKAEYNEMCHKLTSSYAKAINGSFTDVQGYIAQNNKKSKI